MTTMKLDTQAQVVAAERTLRLAWIIVFGAVLFSVLTVTPLVERVTPDRWDWTAPILPVVVDAAVIIVVRVDAIVARLDGRPGGWPALLRWLTGVMTLALNVGDSALAGDLVGVGVHMVAPILLIVTAEASLKWRRAITQAIARIERERAEEAARVQAEREARVQAERAERERERAEARAAEREAREHAAALAREQREHEARVQAEAREHEARVQAEAAERARQERAEERAAEAARVQAERAEQLARVQAEREAEEARERAAAAERKRQEQEAKRRLDWAALDRKEREMARDRQAQEKRDARHAAQEKAAASAKRPAPTAEVEKMTEEKALEAVRAGIADGRSVRDTATATGWSVGWVGARYRELRQTVPA